MSSSSNSSEGRFVQQFNYPVLELNPQLEAAASEAEVPEGPPKTLSEEEASARETNAYRRGLLEGQQLGRNETAPLIEQAKASIAAAITEFSRERETYFQEVEAEVVSLALSVARKILNRESQIDPLVLQGVVRAALDRLSASTTIRLHVPAAQLEGWRRICSKDLAHRAVEVVADPAVNGNQCHIETELGSTHLNVEAQLKEIEQGFADLLARAPRNGS